MITRVHIIPTEHAEQCKLVQWLDAKNIPFFAVPNGEKRARWTGKKLRREGVRAGAPDIVLIRPCGIGNVAIEMKRAKGGTVSPEQQRMHLELRKHGWIVILAKGADHAIEQLKELGF